MRGRIVTINSTPAAGAGFTFVVPAGKRWRVVCIRGTLTTVATVANRIIKIRDSSSTFQVQNAVAQVASEVASWCWANGLPNSRDGATPDIEYMIPLPAYWELGAGENLQPTQINFQATDAWGTVSGRFEEWEV